jgi:hypothetical protein
MGLFESVPTNRHKFKRLFKFTLNNVEIRISIKCLA